MVRITIPKYIAKYKSFVPKSSCCTKNLAYPIISVLNEKSIVPVTSLTLLTVPILDCVPCTVSPSTTTTGIVFVLVDSPIIDSVIEFTTVTVNVII